MYTFARTALGQIQTYGDSGSGCFDTFNGQRYDVSVFTNPGGDKAFAYASEWESGWCAQVTVTNHTATPTTSWAVRFDVHDSTLTSSWSTNLANDGPLYTATNVSWNGYLPSTQSTNFGFWGTRRASTGSRSSYRRRFTETRCEWKLTSS